MLCLAVENGHPIVMTAELWLYNSDFEVIRGLQNERLYTYMYTSMLTQIGMYALYFTQQNCLMVHCFTECEVIWLCFFDQSVATFDQTDMITI